MSNFFAELEAGFKNHADQPALILSGQDDWSYAELQQQINRAAAQLAAFGAGAGDRGNSPSTTKRSSRAGQRR